MKTNTSKILFIIPDGVGVKNYLYSKILTYLKEDDASISIWSPLPKSVFQEVERLHGITIEYKYLKLLPEPPLTRLYREAATYARLTYNAIKVNNQNILLHWKRQDKSFKLKQLYRLAETLGTWASKKYSRILFLEKKADKNWSQKIICDYKKQLKELNPYSIFISHQRVSSLMPICLAAKELKIPIVAAVYSWDNLPKARLNILADKYLVWSKYMKDEMNIYYPEIHQNDVILTGTPQFEFYNNHNIISSRDEFATLTGMDRTKRWICFSGDDLLTSPYDQDYLSDIASAVEGTDIQILFRRCPVDFSDRHYNVLNEFADSIVVVDPEWYEPNLNQNWGAALPKTSDISLLVNVAYHCDCVINVGSTMAHDFTMFDKPCLYINYDQKHAQNWTVRKIYNFQHFRSMEGIEAVGWIDSKEEISDKIYQCLNRPYSIGKDRQKWLKKIVFHPVNKASESIADLLVKGNG